MTTYVASPTMIGRISVACDEPLIVSNRALTVTAIKAPTRGQSSFI